MVAEDDRLEKFQQDYLDNLERLRETLSKAHSNVPQEEDASNQRFAMTTLALTSNVLKTLEALGNYVTVLEDELYKARSSAKPPS